MVSGQFVRTSAKERERERGIDRSWNITKGERGDTKSIMMACVWQINFLLLRTTKNMFSQ